jgi:hypothetical protein
LLLKHLCALAVEIGLYVVLKVNKLFKSIHHDNKFSKWIPFALKQTFENIAQH